MTDRIHAITVALDRDMRDDDVECVLKAIRMLRFVADVTPHVVDMESYSARSRVISRVRTELVDAINNAFDHSRDFSK